MKKMYCSLNFEHFQFFLTAIFLVSDKEKNHYIFFSLKIFFVISCMLSLNENSLSAILLSESNSSLNSASEPLFLGIFTENLNFWGTVARKVRKHRVKHLILRQIAENCQKKGIGVKIHEEFKFSYKNLKKFQQQSKNQFSKKKKKFENFFCGILFFALTDQCSYFFCPKKKLGVVRLKQTAGQVQSLNKYTD